MTNTKFRKRALLSSVAMLLVALVALGSATFAWFVDDPTADAKGLTATAQSSTGLQIKTESSTAWSHHAKIACVASTTGGAAFENIVLAPAMFNTKDSKFYSVKAAKASESAPLTTDKWAAVTTVNHNNGQGAYHETITLRKTGAATESQEVRLTGLDLGTAGDMAEAVTVVIKEGSTYHVFRKSAGSVPYWNADITADTTVYSASSANWTAKAAAATGLTESMGTFAAGTNVEKTLDLYVFLDGTHTSVYSDNAVSASQIISSCDLYFSLV